MTEWRVIPGWEGYYESSDDGQVRSVDRIVPYSDGRTAHRRGHLLKPRPDQDGYLHVALNRHGKARNFSVHCLVLLTFVGPRPEGCESLHGDHDPGRNHVDNLRWGTHAQNIREAVERGTHAMVGRTHCHRGHPLEAPNLVPSSLRRGLRGCLSCSRATSSRSAKSAGFDLQRESDRHYSLLMGEIKKPARICKRGHSLIEPNLRRCRNSHQCLACYRASMRRMRDPDLNVEADSDRRYTIIMAGTDMARLGTSQAEDPARVPAQRGTDAARAGTRAGW